jgi:hypothetical protein
MKAGEGNTAFDYCKGCTHLTEKLQTQYHGGKVIMQPFCTHYQLHFAFVRGIEQCHKTCMHYNEGHI